MESGFLNPFPGVGIVSLLACRFSFSVPFALALQSHDFSFQEENSCTVYSVDMKITFINVA